MATAIRLETLVAGCRKLGMHVVARTDPHAARDDVRTAHPDWISDGDRRTAEAALGQPGAVDHLRARTYNFEFMDQVHREIVDQIQSRRHLCESMGAAGGRLLLRELPEELPGSNRTGTAAHQRPPGPGAARVRRVAQSAADVLWKRWDETVRAANPDASFIPNGPPDARRRLASSRRFSSPITRRAEA